MKSLQANIMKVLVLGATGATGNLVVRQLIKKNVHVKAVKRSGNSKLDDLLQSEYLETITGNISEFNFTKNLELINDCNAVICCLGHNISFSGIMGKPRKLVSDSIKNVCNAIDKSKNEPVKLILMSTTANANIKLNENYTAKDRAVLSFLKLFLPPHKDNIEAASYLVKTVGENNSRIEWAAVRPDALINEEKESKYEICESPKRSPVFDPGKTSRINVAHFIVELLLNEDWWDLWRFKMPVIYNKEK